KITLNFSTLELILSSFVTRLISEDSKIGVIVTCEMSFQNLLKAFDSLAKYKLGKTQNEKITKIIKRLNNVEQERNKATHSAYANKENSDEITRLKVTAKQGKGLSITAEPVKIDNLKKVMKDISQLIQDIEVLYKEIYKDKVIKFA
ncbi:MAG: hypothetical protein V1760_00585, partial [Candidatus Peregrinibacteria bacterium]